MKTTGFSGTFSGDAFIVVFVKHNIDLQIYSNIKRHPTQVMNPFCVCTQEIA